MCPHIKVILSILLVVVLVMFCKIKVFLIIVLKKVAVLKKDPWNLLLDRILQLTLSKVLIALNLASVSIFIFL